MYLLVFHLLLNYYYKFSTILYILYFLLLCVSAKLINYVLYINYNKLMYKYIIFFIKFTKKLLK